MKPGFTLLEVMVALAIAAMALTVLISRVGASADIQHDLSLHAMALSTAVNQLEATRLQPGLPHTDTHGLVEIKNMALHWHGTVKKTESPGFVRQDMEVTAGNEPPVTLFLYRTAP